MDEENNEGDRSYDRMNSNAGNIGFAASVDTGMNGIKVNVQCEQFTFYNQFADSTASTWCNRNSKIGLAHPQAGEIMLATWLLPYNEGVAQWVDPFYDAGADSHTNIMGSMGASSSAFYNPVFGRTNGFNRRQENIIQYWSPNWNGFVFRFAWTLGNNDETNNKKGHSGGTEIDPIIRSSSLAYTNGPLWLAVTWQDHEDWAAFKSGAMDTSDAESFRVAGRYIMDMGDGVSIQLAAMWEDVEHEFNGVTSVAQAMGAFGYGNFDSYNLMFAGKDDVNVKDQKTIGLLRELFPKCWDKDDHSAQDGVATAGCPAAFGTRLPAYVPGAMDDPSTAADETKATGAAKNNADTSVNDATTTTTDAGSMLKAAIMALDTARKATITESSSTEDKAAKANAEHAYQKIVTEAKKRARNAFGAGSNVKIERDAWMVSGKIKFGGPVDFRFSYADADDLEVSCSGCSGDWDQSGGDAWNVGLFYTMPGGTELRMTYSEVNSDDNVGYGQSIPGTGVGNPGNEIEMFALGIVHWFD